MRITFQPDPRRPRNEHNQVPLYAVTWDSKRGRTGNVWKSRAQAERTYRRMEELGRNPEARLQYCAGFAL